MGRPNDGPDSAQLRSRLQQVEKELGALRQLMQAMEKRLDQEIKRREDAQRQYEAERKAEARNSQLAMRVGQLSHLLHTTLESRPPTLDDLYAAAPQVERSPEDEVPAVPRRSDFRPHDLNLLERLSGRRREAQAEAETLFVAAVRDQKRRKAELDKRHARRVEQALTAHRRGISEIADAAQRCDPDALARLACDLVLISTSLKQLLGEVHAAFDSSTRKLSVHVALPACSDVIPAEREWIAEHPWRESTAVLRTDEEVAAMYADLAGQLALAVGANCLRALEGTVVDVVQVTCRERSAGSSHQHAYLVEVVVTRAALAALEAALSSPQEWLRRLGAVVSPGSPGPTTSQAG